ncbi:MAG: tripartite tricarboxylate transporter substrate binding protein [Desulfosarcina sp.]|nr:tripartite tricarboxylate transporter substrate binding protein [Desulfobacterales bacterium]
MKKRFLVLMMSVFAIGLFSPAYAADFPDKDLQGVIMWGAGGATDNVARALTPNVEPFLGKQLILINKPGGTGAISTQYVYSRPSDGYTLLFGAENPQVHRILELSTMDYKDFYPVNILGRGVGVIVANKDMPWNSFKDLIDDAKKRPGKIKMGSTGPGGLPYTVGAMTKSVTAFDVTSVPFKGEGPGVTALLGGHVDFMPAGITAVREHIRANRVKVLAVVSDTPVPGLEDIPLITKDFPDFNKYLPWGPFYGVWCKKDVPEATKKKLVEAFQKGAAEPKFQAFLKDFGTVSMNISGAEADAFLKKWQSVTNWMYEYAGAAKVSPAKLGIPKP